MNISAPKIWVPIASQNAEGSVFVDAGTLRVAGMKDEGEADMNWDVQAKSIRMNFVRGRNLPQLGDELPLSLLSQLTDTTGRGETCIVRPFHVSLEARNQSGITDDGFLCLADGDATTGSARSVNVIVSPVSLNLVDAEALARAFGRWYSHSLHRVRRRMSSASTQRISNEYRAKQPRTHQEPDQPLNRSTMPQILSVTLEKVEIALEGHSKPTSAGFDERSLASQESFHEVAPSTRTYLVEVTDISIWQSRRDECSSTQLAIQDAEISRLRDGTMYSPLKGRREASGSQYCILTRANENEVERPQPAVVVAATPKRPGRRTTNDGRRSEILRASLMHDGKAHLDEVDVEIDSVVLRVTPTTLKDCAKAFRRVAELAQLMTKEMERKVHEEGRKARRRVEKSK